jgi:hypothetical protein
MLVLFPFCDERLLLGLGEIAGNGSVFSVAMIACVLIVWQGEREIVE